MYIYVCTYIATYYQEILALASCILLLLKDFDILHFKGDYVHESKESSADINHFLQHVEAKFLDVLIPVQQIVTQEYLGKGMEVYRIYYNVFI